MNTKKLLEAESDVVSFTPSTPTRAVHVEVQRKGEYHGVYPQVDQQPEQRRSHHVVETSQITICSPRRIACCTLRSSPVSSAAVA